MPDQPTWLERVADILAKLNEPSSPPFLDRPAVELLFGLRRRQAIELMRCMDGYQVGRTFLVDRASAVAFLSRPALSDATARAVRRKQRVLDELAVARSEWKARSIRIPAPEPGSPPEGVQLRPGELLIRFDEPAQLLQKLAGLAQLLARDYEGVMAAISREPHSGSPPNP